LRATELDALKLFADVHRWSVGVAVRVLLREKLFDEPVPSRESLEVARRRSPPRNGVLAP
jgi:hypothetical protein